MSALPTWEGLLSPILTILSDGRERGKRAVEHDVAALLQLSDDALAETVGSGKSRFVNRVGWSLSFLARAEALRRPRRGQYEITDAGRELLAEHPAGLDESILRTIPAYIAYVPQVRSSVGRSVVSDTSVDSLDPTEQIEQGAARLNADVAAELLKRLYEQDPAFLEQSVLDVLIAMGYGGADKRAQRTQLTNDGGIDGIIDQDPLGLDRIYVQAKRYAPENAVQRPEIHGFAGALLGKQASQGVFITTSRFSQGAIDFADGVAA